MKEEIVSLIRDYVEGNLDVVSLDKSISASLPKCSHKRGQSIWLPSGKPLDGMKFEHAELYRLHRDVKAGKFEVESALFVIDMITMYREFLVNDGSIFVDEIDGIGTPEDLSVWRERVPFSR